MLIAKDLALIRAALQHFREENCTADGSGIRLYIDNATSRGITAEYIAALGETLSQSRIRYLKYDTLRQQVVSTEILSKASTSDSQATSSSQILVPVLIPTRLG